MPLVHRGSVYVHCHGGKGRAATIATAWVMHSQGLSAEAALAYVRERRKITNLAKWGGILPVWRALKQFELDVRP
jgi:protein-tyrosine phosphatase